jgi:hypothetical protein
MATRTTSTVAGNVGHVKWIQKLWQRVRDRAEPSGFQIRDLHYYR